VLLFVGPPSETKLPRKKWRFEMRKMRNQILIVALVLPLQGLAQGTLFVSTLNQTPTGNATVASDSWVAQEFFVGSNPQGYTIKSVQLLMGTPSGSPFGFSVALYDAVGGIPGNNLGSLIGEAPSTGGIFTYSTSGIAVLPGLHLVVVTAESPLALGAYDWSAGPGVGQGGGAIGTDGWRIGHLYWASTDGISWDYSRDKYFQMAIYATPVPEPGTMGLVALGLAALSFLWHRERK
jgi:hypothetical protein